MDAILAKVESRLRAHIQDIDLQSISRVSLERIQQRALPHLSVIEFVTGDVYANHYARLYEAMFHGGEREKSTLIVERLQQEAAGKRRELAPYRVVGIRDHDGQAIAAAQFSILFLADDTHAVPYLQYIYTRPQNRRQDMSELLHTLVLAVTMADAAEKGCQVGKLLEVPFTFFETEPPSYGADAAQQAVAAQRTQIHSKSGSVAMMLREKHSNALYSAHVQPGLDEPGDPTITLIWALRANPAVDMILRDNEMGTAVLTAYYRSLRDEGFLECNIAFAEKILRERQRRDCEFCLIPLAEVTREMYIDIDDKAIGVRALSVPPRAVLNEADAGACAAQQDTHAFLVA